MTDGVGSFTAPNLPPGIYEIKVEAPGFAAKVVRAQVTVGSTVSIDISLEIGRTETIVNVPGYEGPRVETKSPELSTIINQIQLRELPTLTRNSYDLVRLSGNISSLDSFADPTEGDVTSRGVGFAINPKQSYHSFR